MSKKSGLEKTLHAAFDDSSGFTTERKIALLSQVSSDVVKSHKSWEESSASWIAIANCFCRFKDTEKSSDASLQLAETLLLAPLILEVEDEFSVKPRNMIRMFEAWENIYDTIIEACSKDPDRCCAFAHFDVSKKGNVLESFCTSVNELYKILVETLQKHSDKQTGIAAELLSKSVLNELEAATYLVSEIAKPAHIVLVISALAKFMGQCIVLVVEKKCRMFRKYHPKVFTMVKTALSSLKKLYSGPYCTSLLSQLEPILINGFRSPRLRSFLVEFWQQTFGRATHLDLSDELSTALEVSKCASTSFIAELSDFSTADNSSASLSCDTNSTASVDEEINSNGREVKEISSKGTKLPASRSKILRRASNSNEEYAVIEAPVCPKKMRLTDHQKEKLAQKSDSLLCIPGESQSVDLNARLPPGYTDNSSSQSLAEKEPLLEKSDSVKASVNVHSEKQNVETRENDPSVNEITGNTEVEEFVIPLDDSLGGQQNKEESEKLSSASKIVLPNGVANPGEVAEPLSSSSSSPSYFVKCEASEIASPSSVLISPEPNVNEPPRTPSSILKNSGARALCPPVKSFSASEGKCKRVHFDPSTLDDDELYGPPRRKLFRQSRTQLFPAVGGRYHVSPRTKSPVKPLVPLTVNKDPAKAVFPLLIDSMELIPPQIYLKLAPAMSSLLLRSILKARGVATIGELALLSEQDIETFPFRDPKLNRLLKALEDHFRMKKNLSALDAMNLDTIMKRPQKTLDEYLEEVPSPLDEALVSETVEEQHGISAGSSCGAGTAFEVHGNKSLSTSEGSSDRINKQSQENGGSLAEATHQGVIPGYERTRFGFRNPIVGNQNPMIGRGGRAITSSNTGITVDPLRRDYEARKLPAKSSRLLSDKNSPLSSDSKTTTDQNVGRAESRTDDVASSLRTSLHLMLQNPVIAAIKGNSNTTMQFSQEDLLCLWRACCDFQIAVLNSAYQEGNKK